MFSKSFPLAAALFVTSLPAVAQDIKISGAFARETPPSAQVGGAFLTLENHGAADRLVGGSSPVAERVELHNHTKDSQGVMRMREVEGGIALPAHTTVALEPGGLHIMLMDLNQPLKMGETIHLDLQFESGATQSVMVPVKKIGAMGGDHAGHDMKHSTGD